MPVERVPLSISQFAELMGIDPSRVLDVEVNRPSSRVVLVLEPEENAMAQTSGIVPQLNQGKGGKKKGGKRGC